MILSITIPDAQAIRLRDALCATNPTPTVADPDVMQAPTQALAMVALRKMLVAIVLSHESTLATNAAINAVVTPTPVTLT